MKNEVVKQSLISIYCHYSGFSIIALERTISLPNYLEDQKADKRWTVAKLVSGIASYESIAKELKALKKEFTPISPIIFNSEVAINEVIRGGLKFRALESDLSTESKINQNVFPLICYVNDNCLAFKPETASLIEQVKYFNQACITNELNALILAVNALPSNAFNHLLFS